MAAPVSFIQSFDFGDFSTSNPADPQPGAQMDAVFGLLKTTTDELIANLNVIQRSDTKLANSSVHVDALDTATLNLLGTTNWTPKGVWLTATAYVVGDVVSNGTTTYVGVVAHTSGTFATDLASGNWTPITSSSSTDGLLVTDFGATGDGVTDDSAAIAAAFAAASDGQLITFPPGTYLMLTGVSVTNKSLHVQGYGATILQGANIIPFLFDAPFTNITSSTGVTDVVVDLNDDATGSTLINQVAFASAAGFVVGDICKLVADDAIPGGNNASARIGEFIRVAGLSGNNVQTSSRVRETYSTAPRLAKMNTAMKVSIRGLQFTTQDAGEAAGWNKNLMHLRGLYQPILQDVGVLRAHTAAIQINGCLGASAVNCYFRDCLNEVATSRVGYGILSTSSEYGTFTNCVFIDCRHGYTTGVTSTSTGDTAIDDFGRTAHEVISNCTGFACSNGPFDTHWDAFNVTFSNCTAFGTYLGDSSGGMGFNIRGRNNTVDGCQSINTEVGFVIRGEDTNGNIGTTLRNSKYVGAGRGIAITAGAAGETVKEARIENCLVDTTAKSASNATDAVLFQNCTDTTVDGLRIIARYDGGTTRRVIDVGEAAVVKINNLSMDVSDTSVDIRELIRMQDANSSVEINGMDIVAGAADLDNLFNPGGVATTVIARNIRLDVAPDVGVFFNATNATTLIENYWVAGVPQQEWRQIGDIFTIEITCGQAALASAGQIKLIDNASNDDKQFKVRDIIFTGEGTDFSGGGGDRGLDLRSTGAANVWTVVPAATMQSLAADRWGATAVPFPAVAAAILLATAAGADIFVQYSGGTTDYTAGECKLLVTLERTA